MNSPTSTLVGRCRILTDDSVPKQRRALLASSEATTTAGAEDVLAITRKFAHFTTTLAVVPFPYVFTSHWYILILAIFFFAALFITQHAKQLKSIHDINRKSIGSYLLPLSIYITFLVSFKLDNKFVFIHIQS